MKKYWNSFSEFMIKPRSDGTNILGTLVFLMVLLAILVFVASRVFVNINGSACINDRCYVIGNSVEQ